MLDLFVVMPVYNEGECIQAVVESWLGELSRQGLDFRLCVLNDGSTDDTLPQLKAFGEAIDLVDKPNSGHGPTLLEGYRRGVRAARWVFQTDSDGEIAPEHLARLWACREEVEAVFGVREQRHCSASRLLLTRLARMVVGRLFSCQVKDVNCPFRLLRSDVLTPVLEALPPDTFAPNLLISGALGQPGGRIRNVPVSGRDRQGGRSSLTSWRLVQGCLKALLQTLRCRQAVREARTRLPGPR